MPHRGDALAPSRLLQEPKLPAEETLRLSSSSGHLVSAEPSSKDNMVVVRSSFRQAASEFSRMLSTSTESSVRHHPVFSHPELLESIRLIRGTAFASLACPLERSQDLPAEHFGTPAQSDVVFAISHAWRNQTHPDPKGSKHRAICELLAQEQLNCGEILLFMDWVGISQRPFRPGQPHRTPEESKDFAAALRNMHHMYFCADRVIHLENEEELIEGEGVEYWVPTGDLRSAEFAEIGDWVQIVGGAPPDPPPPPRCGLAVAGPCWALFDRVLSVDDVRVRSAEHLRMLLDPPKPASRVRLCRYPFGRVNTIPADCRGWVYLERFITMVKCAMLDEASAHNVVVTNSPSIGHQILSGATILRDAARLDEAEPGPREAHQAGKNLKEALHGFLQELEAKQFSAASTDKLVLDKEAAAQGAGEAEAAGPPPDREVVAGIMTQFVEHLCERWQHEAKKQQRREKRLGAVFKAAQAYFLVWERFSDHYMAELEGVSAWSAVHLLVLLVLPPMLTWCWVLPPYSAPDQGLQSQQLFIWYGQASLTLLCAPAFPLWLTTVSGVQRDWRVASALCLWVACTVAFDVLVRAVLIWWWDVFPLPMGPVIAVLLCGLCLPLMWFCLPKRQRRDRQFRKRALCAFLALNAVLGVFGVAFPLMNVALSKLAVGLQAVAILTYFVCRLGFERVGDVVAKYVGADVAPCFGFAGTVAYELNLFVALAGGLHTVVVAELIALDLTENVYYLWSLARQEAKRRDAIAAVSAEARAVQYYIVSQLVLRQFVQLLVPLQYLATLLVVRRVRPQFSDTVCRLDDAEFGFLALTIALNVAVQLTAMSGSVVLLRRYGFAPLRMLQGVVATRRWELLATAICATTHFVTLQFAHYGVDLTFKFLWVEGAHTHWRCGLQWTV